MRCRSCGAEIVWIRMQSGKRMPCDPEQVLYREDQAKKGTIVTPNGETVRCEYPVGSERATGIGYISHFATCPNAKNHRRK